MCDFMIKTDNSVNIAQISNGNSFEIGQNGFESIK